MLDLQKAFSILTRVGASVGHVPDGSRFDNVTNDKLFDGLVFGDGASTVGASNGLGVTTAFLGSSVIAAFTRLSMGTLHSF